MSRRPLRPCTVVGCPNAAEIGGRCREHALQAQRERDANRPSAARRGYDAAWRETRAEFLAANPYCVRCGAPATVVHHIRPRRFGGSDDWSNLQALCKHCHDSKTMRESVRG